MSFAAATPQDASNSKSLNTTSPSFDGGRFFVDLIPAWPAYALLVAAIPALVPTLVHRLGSRIVGEPQVREVSRAGAVTVLVLAVVVTTVLAALLLR